MTIEGRLDYESFRLGDDESCVMVAEAALNSEGLKPKRGVSNGGLDANWMHVHRIPTVTMGCGQMNAPYDFRTTQYCRVPSFMPRRPPASQPPTSIRKISLSER